MTQKHWLYLIGAVLLAFWFGKNYGTNTARGIYSTATYPPDTSQYPTVGPIPL